jgi:hypothetical protein
MGGDRKTDPTAIGSGSCGKVAGFAEFGPCRDDGAHTAAFGVWAIYINPQFIGFGAVRVTLWVLVENELAIRFYRAAGFTEDVGSRKSIQLGGVLADEVRYAQNIRANWSAHTDKQHQVVASRRVLRVGGLDR